MGLNGFYDAFVAKVTSEGTLAWASFLGGLASDYGYGIAVDDAGNAILTGRTTSSDFSTPGGFDTDLDGGNDAFVAKVTAGGSLVWASYLGGSGDDSGYGIAMDAAGNAILTGTTSSNDFPTPGGFDTNLDAWGDAFVAKVTAGGTLAWASYLGGRSTDVGRGIAVDAAGNVLLTGETWSDNFPTLGGFDEYYNGGYDAFVAKISGAGTPATPFELLARGVAYGEVALPSGYTLAQVFQDNATGLYALGLTSAIYGPALVLRGTEPTTVSDWLADFDSRGVGYQQFIANWTAGQNISGWLASQSTPVDIIGHSLGGALAQWIAAEWTSTGHQIDQLVTFNSPGISNSPSIYPGLLTYASEFVSSQATNVVHYIVNGDIVSMAGEAFLAGAVQMATFDDLNLLDNHLLPLLETNVGGRARPDDISWATYSTVTALNSPTFSYTDRDYNLWLLGASTVLYELSSINPGVAPLLVVPAALKWRGTTEQLRHVSGPLISQAIRTAEGLWHWTQEAVDRFCLVVDQRVGDLYELLTPHVTTGFSLTNDGGSPARLRFDGGLDIDLGDNISIALPWWLGGTWTADHLLEMVSLDTSGVIDRNGLAVDGQFELLGGFVDVAGSASLDWSRGTAQVNGTTSIGGGFTTTSASVQVSDDLDFTLRGSATVSIPSEVPWIGGKTLVGGQCLLTFTNDGDYANDFVAGWGTLGSLALGLQVFFDGSWNILWGREVESLEQTAPDSVRGDNVIPLDESLLPYGESYPIAAGTDWAMFVVQWANDSSTAAITLRKPSGQVLTEADIAADPTMQFVTELTDLRRKTVRVNNPAAGNWRVELEDTTGLGTADISAWINDTLPSINVASATGGANRTPVDVRLEAYDADSVARVAVFYDTDASGFDGVLIADGLIEVDGPLTYTWNTEGLPAGEYYLYARIVDDANAPVLAYGAAPVQISDETVAPRLTGVAIGSSAWSASSPAYPGYAVPVGSGQQLVTLPWNNLDRIVVTFSEDVIVDKLSLRLLGADSAEYELGSATFTYDAATFRATWTLLHAIVADKLLIVLDGTSTAPVRDRAGNPLDGEWTNPITIADTGTSIFPSGNGVAGGDFQFRLDVLAGDVSADGVVNAVDLARIRANMANPIPPGSNAHLRADLSGDGIVDAADYAWVRANVGHDIRGIAAPTLPNEVSFGTVLHDYATKAGVDVQADSQFGYAVAVDGEYAVVGQPGAVVGGKTNTGRAYVFSTSTGELVATLANPSPETNDYFGFAVAISGRNVVVGAFGNNQDATNDGAAYVFDAETGSLLHVLANPQPGNDDYFGVSVAVSGNTIVVGASYNDTDASDSGIAYVFDATTGNRQHTLHNPHRAAYDYFGRSVAVSGNYVLVGAPTADAGAWDDGGAYLFDAASGALIRDLVNPTPANEDGFGYALAIDGNVIVVGAYRVDTSDYNAGEAYVFDVTDENYYRILTDPTPAANKWFGIAVGVFGETVLVGASYDDYSQANAGEVHAFDVSTGDRLSTVTSPTPAGGDRFGYSVSVSDDKALIGAYGMCWTPSATPGAYLVSVNRTSMSITASSVSENESAGTPVETLPVVASTVTDSLAWHLATGEGDPEHGNYEIVESTRSVVAPLPSMHTARVQPASVTDQSTRSETASLSASHPRWDAAAVDAFYRDYQTNRRTTGLDEAVDSILPAWEDLTKPRRRARGEMVFVASR